MEENYSNEMKKKAHANWSVSLDIECPHCDRYFDLMDEDEWHIKYGDVAECPNVDEETECPHCRGLINITEIIY